MDANHPKRRKDKLNPYTIYQTKQGDCYISFVDGAGVHQRLKVSQELYNLFDTFELEDKSYMNEVDRHIERSEQTDESLNARAINGFLNVEDQAICELRKAELHRAIENLPKVQRRRLIMYYFRGLTYEQIAEKEGCTIMPIKRSVDAAIKKLKIFLK